MKSEIKAWLTGPRNYTEGIALYEKYGFNKNLKNSFSKMNPATMMDTLVYELAKMTDITQAQTKTMPRTAQTDKPIFGTKAASQEKTLEDMILELAEKLDVAVDDIFGLQSDNEEMQETIGELKKKYDEVPETTKQVIRFREKYPFLKSPGCPAELKVMVSDMFSAYDAYRDAYAALSDKNSQPENLVLAAEVVEKYMDNRAMWAELEYYKEHETLLGKHPIFETLKLRQEIAALSDLDLAKRMTNAKPNITKSKSALARAETDEEKATATERLERWENTRSELQAELDRRKK